MHQLMKRFRFSMAIFATVLVILVVALVLSRLEVSSLRSQLHNIVPMTELDIAVQVERQTADAGIAVDTTQILYSPIGSTYLVGFTYIDPGNDIPANGTLKLLHERDGRYVGYIRDQAFLRLNPDEKGERGLRVTAIDRRTADAIPDSRQLIQTHE